MMTEIPQTPISKVSVPPGHVLSAAKWKGLDVVTSLRVLGPVSFSDALGLVDFHPSSEAAVVYLTESDIVSGVKVKQYQNNLTQMRKVNCMRVVVLVEKTILTEQYFHDIQKFVVLILGLKLVPVQSANAAAKFLHEMAIAESKARVNPFRIPMKKTQPNNLLVDFLQEIPGLDEIKAKALLKKYSSIQKICNATKDQLSSTLGPTIAGNVKLFLSKHAN